MYSAGRLLFSVTFDGKGKWNKTFGHLSRRQLPQNALTLSALLMGCAPLITLVIGDQAFNFISSTSTSMFLIIWSLMILTHMAYRRKTAANQLNDFQMPGYPYIDYVILSFFVLMIILLLIYQATEYQWSLQLQSLLFYTSFPKFGVMKKLFKAKSRVF